MAFIAHPLPKVVRTTTTTDTPSQSLKCSLPPRVLLDPLPNLFVYDHCPFCVRVRHALGLKNVKHNLVWLLNDDVATPTSLIGKKMVPIFQPQGTSGPSVGESLDIIKLIDSDEKYGKPGLFNPEENMDNIASVIGEMSKPLSRLTRTRYALSPFQNLHSKTVARPTFAIIRCRIPSRMRKISTVRRNTLRQYRAKWML